MPKVCGKCSIFYSGNFLPGGGNELEGKEEARYGKWGGICLMTQEHTITFHLSCFFNPKKMRGGVFAAPFVFFLSQYATRISQEVADLFGVPSCVALYMCTVQL